MDPSVCPRCEAEFECGLRGGNCWCAGVELDTAVVRDLAKFYDGCLCADCIKTLAETKPARPSVRAFLKAQVLGRHGRQADAPEQAPDGDAPRPAADAAATAPR